MAGESVRVLSIAEIPFLARAVGQLPTLQKAGHGIIELPTVLKKVVPIVDPTALLALAARTFRLRRQPTDEDPPEDQNG